MGRSHHGLSLTEMLVVVTILGIVAVVTVPSFTSSDASRLDLAANEVAAAIRFSRSEAMRTGEPHGVHVSKKNQQVNIYQLVMVGGTPTPEYTVRHPVSKKLYDLILPSMPASAGVIMDSGGFRYLGLTNPVQYLTFDRKGEPHYTEAGVTYLLVTGPIMLKLSSQTRVINIAPVTGRVTVSES